MLTVQTFSPCSSWDAAGSGLYASNAARFPELAARRGSRCGPGQDGHRDPAADCERRRVPGQHGDHPLRGARNAACCASSQGSRSRGAVGRDPRCLLRSPPSRWSMVNGWTSQSSRRLCPAVRGHRAGEEGACRLQGDPGTVTGTRTAACVTRVSADPRRPGRPCREPATASGPGVGPATADQARQGAASA
jgi:hypothetical protein